VFEVPSEYQSANPLENFAAEYLEIHSQSHKETEAWFKGIDEAQAVEAAALLMVPTRSGNGRKRHDHFRWHSSGKFTIAAKVLTDQMVDLRVAAVADFDTLHQFVTEKLLPIKGLGPLAFYDISLLLGYHYGVRPQYVYLHAGSLKGARCILLQSNVNKRVEVDFFPYAFRRLTAAQIEDLLCIYSKELSKLTSTDWIRIDRDWRGT
jgi:hypothetical protein